MSRSGLKAEGDASDSEPRFASQSRRGEYRVPTEHDAREATQQNKTKQNDNEND